MTQHERMLLDGLKAENKMLRSQMTQVNQAQEQAKLIGLMLTSVIGGLCANSALAAKPIEELSRMAVKVTNQTFYEMNKEGEDAN